MDCFTTKSAVTQRLCLVPLWSCGNRKLKPALSEALWAKLSPNVTSVPAVYVQYVLDGGALLHQISWPGESAMYQDVWRLYCSHYVTRKYRNPIVVFDGYDECPPRTWCNIGELKEKLTQPYQSFSEDMKATLKKDHFLANSKNKQQFINTLIWFLQNSNCKIYQAKGDADVLIVPTALVRNCSRIDHDTCRRRHGLTCACVLLHPLRR